MTDPNRRGLDSAVATPSTRRRYLVRELVDAAGGIDSIPRYGSVRWLVLPQTHPAWIAALAVAAECWVRDGGDELVDRLEIEIAERRRVEKADEDSDYIAGMAEHRRRWAHLRLVTPAETENRPPFDPANLSGGA